MNEITRWNPLREMTAMREVMDRMFDETWRPLFEPGGMRLSERSLALDIQENDDNYTVVTELPGVKADDIHVKLEGDYLMIDGEIPEETVENKEGARTIMKERHYGKFSRSVRLPQVADSEKVDAVYKDGVLTLTLPKKAEAKPKLIQVKVAKK